MRIAPPAFLVPVFLAIFVQLVGGSCLPAQERMSPELLWKLSRVSDPQVSATGDRMLYSIRNYRSILNFC